MTHPAASPAVAADAAELPEPPFPPQLVEELMRSFSKAVKAHQLYLPNNPIYQRSIDSARQAFAPIWRETEGLVLQVGESELRWEGRPVLREPSRTESLPWVLYKDGVRELTLEPGFEAEELVTLLNIIQRVRKTSPEEDDLLTLLWEQEFAHLRYRFVDVHFELAAPIEPSPEVEQPRNIQVVIDVPPPEPEPEPVRGPGIVRMEDLDATLYFLDEHEIDYLRSEVQNEQHMDLRRNVLAILLDIFEVQGDGDTRDEIAGIFEEFLVQLLAAGQYGVVAHMLSETATLSRTVSELTPAVAERLRHLPDRLSDVAVFTQLLQSLEDADTIPAQEELDALFDQLGPATLGVVLAWLRQVQKPQLRTGLERAAARLASANTAELLKLIGSDDPVVAMEAIRRAGELKTAAVVAPLAKIMTKGDVPLRQVAAQALAEIGSPGALRLLELALDDADRDVRLVALRAIGGRGHRSALPKVEALVKGKGVKDADLTEKMAYFEAYGALAGESAVGQLDEMLNGRTFLGRRPDAEIRACAAMALGKIGSPRAMEVLRRAGSDKDPRVRSEINKALRGGTP